MQGFRRLLEQHKQIWATLVLQPTSTMTMSIMAQDRRPLLRLLRAGILSVQHCNLQRTRSSLLELGYFEQEDQDAVLSTIETVAKKFNVTRADWNDLNVLLLHAAQAAALDLSLVANPIESIKSAKFLYLMGADDIALHTLPDNAFVVYQGHHDDKGVYRANVIMPSSANNRLD